MPDSLLEIEAQTALLPQQADVSAAGQMSEEMAWDEPLLTPNTVTLDKEPAREETPPHEAVAIVQGEALATNDEAAAATTARMVPQEVPTTLALVGAADADRGGRSSPSLVQAGNNLPAGGGARHEADSQDPSTAILTFGNKMEDTEWRNISDALFAALRDVTAPACQV
jgi:hypothetical protein